MARASALLRPDITDRGSGGQRACGGVAHAGRAVAAGSSAAFRLSGSNRAAFSPSATNCFSRREIGRRECWWREVVSREARQLAANSFMFEEFLAREIDAGRFKPALAPIANTALLHGHCHQKAFDAVAPVAKVLAKVPGLKADLMNSSCCGMAGAFGYQQETYRCLAGNGGALTAARGAERAGRYADRRRRHLCRHQIHDGSGRRALHVAAVLARSMAAAQHGEVVINSKIVSAESV